MGGVNAPPAFWKGGAILADNILVMDHITKEFPGVKALDNVNLEVQRGEIHALIGENGAGKSTLMNVLSGQYPYGSYTGTVTYEGEECKFKNLNDSEAKGIVIIHQELALIPLLSIGENMFLGNEIKNKRGSIDWDKTYSEAEKHMAQVGLHESAQTLIKDIGTGKQQLVEIAKAFSKDVKLLILDEPTSSLTAPEVAKLFKMMRQLKSQGISLIYISHKMDEIFEICDQISVLRDGSLVMTKDSKDTNMNELISAMVGRSLDNRFPPVDNTPGETILSVQNLSTKYAPKLQNISFDVKKGEIFGLYGLVGAGRTELLETIFGMRTRAAGNVIYDGKMMNFASPKDAMNHGFALITEERKANGLFLKADITFNTTIANMNHYKSGLALSHDDMVRATAEEIKVMHTKCMGPDDMIANLSGGNQQKVIFGKWLERSPNIFMMDDPTRGIDVGAKYEIYELIINMAKQGKTIIVVSSEMPEILGITNRIGVMSNGHLAGIVNTKETNQEELLKLSAKYL